jgi:peptidoglycan/xylan/chitin deacetylase (PgdA/CDA1 family)
MPLMKKSWLWIGLGIFALSGTVGAGLQWWSPEENKNDDVGITIPILMYHHIGNLTVLEQNTRKADWSVTEENFNEQCELLVENGYTPVSMEQIHDALENGESLPGKPVCITFDDGWREQYEIGLPILEKHGLTATFFVYPGPICESEEEKSGYMCWPQLHKLVEGGHDIQSHSWSHPHLAKIPAELARVEMESSRRALEEQLGITVSSIAYPFGDHNEQVQKMAESAGYTTAVSCYAGVTQSEKTRMHLRRVTVQYADTPQDFLRKLEIGR